MAKGIFKKWYWTPLLFLIILLNACSSLNKQDGPPPYDVDVSKIPDAVPKVEAKSKYGNMRSYTVLGRTYYVMPSSKNYHARGVASWYGTKFHAHHTSNGERYNMLAMTAAHKTLPLPTYLRVTNLTNHRTVIVKVNDRGPFEANRIIDLSYVAAKKLGMLGRGTAPVELTAINPETYHSNESDPLYFNHSRPYRSHHTTPAPIHHSNEPDFYLQVGVFSQKSNAERLKQKLSSKLSAPVSIATVMIHHRHLYRVKVGPLHTLAERHALSTHLKTLGLDSKAYTEV